jgi:cell division protein FtsB
MAGTDCGSKHLRLAGLIIGVVLTVCAATIGYAQVKLGELDARVRMVEQDAAANAARFEAIKESLQRLEAQR